MTQSAAAGRSRRRWIALAIGIVLVLILLLLLLRSCHSAAPPFDYFRAKAQDLGNDPNRIVSFVRDGMPTLPYRGDVKGALGALWNGAASPEEKQALAAALLSAAGKSRQVSLDEVAPSRNKSTDQAQPAPHLSIVHRIETTPPKDTTLYDGPAGALVGDVHTVETLEGGKRRITLRGAAGATVDLNVPDDAAGEDLIFTWHIPGQSPKAPAMTTTRELWHRDNRVGAKLANVGDRHDFVVIPCRIGKYVREKEELLLKQRGRAKSPEAPAYLGLLDYAMDSDSHLGQMEKTMKVTALFDQPRVLVLSRFVAPNLPGGIAYALDLRADRVGFAGGRVPAYRAAQVRSFLESSLEHQFLQKYSGLPSSATFEVFAMIKDDEPDSCGRRITQIRSTLESLQRAGSPANSATFSIAPDSRTKGAPLPQRVKVYVAGDGVHVGGGPILKAVAAGLADQKEPGAVKVPASGTAVFATVDDAAVAVETDLLAADVKPPVSDDYRLATTIDRSAVSLVQKDARFHFEWGEGSNQTDQDIDIVSPGRSLTYDWRVQSGVLPAAGTREILPEALNSATVHNPWYRAGASQQSKETSFVVSRAVYAALKSGKPINLSVQQRYGPKDDEKTSRPIEFTAPLTPAGTGSVTVTVNGQPIVLPILKGTLHGQTLAVLDDPIYPIGMADALKTVVTGIQCRLVDEHDVPIAGAQVRLAPERGQSAPPGDTTAPDGRFELPPPPVDVQSYAKDATLEVTFTDQSRDKVRVDLSAPGLSVVVVKVKRPRTKLLYLSRASEVDRLDLSDEVKRQARRDVTAGRTVVIPDHYVSDGIRQYTGYYACDNATGDYVAVTEDGLCGSTDWEQMVHVDRMEVLKALKEMAENPYRAGAAGPLQAFRGAVISWWVYSTCRVGGDSHKQAILHTLEAMKAWTDGMDLSTAVGNLTDDQLGSQLGNLLNSGTINAGGDAAKAAFKLGYIGGTLYLAEKLEGSDAEE